MVRTKRLAPPYSMVVIMDVSGHGEIPKWVRESLVVSTDSCVAVGCQDAHRDSSDAI
jgi:hypothetical protein